MNQGGRLKCLAGTFVGHFMGGQTTQLVIDQRQQIFRGLGITGIDGVEQPGHVAGHGGELRQASTVRPVAIHGGMNLNGAGQSQVTSELKLGAGEY